MRYLVFEYDSYYPSGGMYDCTLRTNDLTEAVEKAKTTGYEYSDIYDTLEDETVGF